MKHVLIAIAVLAFASTTALAHGDRYRGPSGEVPPNMRKPGDPPPPNDNGIPTPPPDEGNGGTPTPPDQGAPGGRPEAPPTGGGAGGPGKIAAPIPGAAGGGTATAPGRRSPPPATTFDSWVFWWAYNDDAILRLKMHLRTFERDVSTVAGPITVGRHHGRSDGTTQAPVEIAIRERVLPVLEAALAPDLHFDIRASAVIALGKIGSTRPDLVSRIAPKLIAIMDNESGREHFSVEESAALSLGLLRSHDNEIVRALTARLLARTRPNARTRAFAALALGLLRVPALAATHDEVVRALRDVVGSRDEAHADVPICALMAMGLSGDPTYVADLVEMVETGLACRTRKLDDRTRSYAAAALGKIAETDSAAAGARVLQVLHKALIGRGVHTQRSIVIALGQIGQRPDLGADLRAKLVRHLVQQSRAGETQAANFATIALGRIAGATSDAALRARIFDALHRVMAKGSHGARPYGALALGLMGCGSGSDETLRQVVRKGFLEYRGDARDRGAYAIALGMLRDRAAVPALLDRLRDRTELRKLRGACAVALGMIRDPSTKDAVRQVLLDDRDPDLRIDTTVALGLLGGSSVIADLVGLLADPRSSFFVQGSITLALGRIGDRRAIDPLIRIVEDGEMPELNRALAVVALGLLGDRNDVPVLGRLAEDVNYRAQVNAVMEVLSIL